MGAGIGTKVPIGMWKGIKVVAHEGTSSSIGIFYKCGYGEGHCSTLPIRYPLPSLNVAHVKATKISKLLLTTNNYSIRFIILVVFEEFTYTKKLNKFCYY